MIRFSWSTAAIVNYEPSMPPVTRCQPIAVSASAAPKTSARDSLRHHACILVKKGRQRVCCRTGTRVQTVSVNTRFWTGRLGSSQSTNSQSSRCACKIHGCTRSFKLVSYAMNCNMYVLCVCALNLRMISTICVTYRSRGQFVLPCNGVCNNKVVVTIRFNMPE